MKALRRVAGFFVIIFALLALAGSASATTRGVVLNAPKSVTVDYAHSLGPSGPLPTIAVEGNVTNNDGHVYACQVVLKDLDFVVGDFTIRPKTSVAWNVVTAYTWQRYVTFKLTCGGAPVWGQTKSVKVLYAPPTF